ncbi:MAG: type IV secretory system conjugative DNA transfer family protein [Methylococcales bacterium]|nr:type IV secretory system conjugative DNA transfer family protein [Methylococcales bacterium]
MKKHDFNNSVGPQVRTKKTKGKLIPSLAVASIIGGLQASTQYFAQDFGFQSALGANFDHIYAPWKIVQWSTQWYGQYPNAISKAGSVGVMVAGSSLLALTFAKLISANSAKANEYLHGSARWANRADIEAAGLLPRSVNFWQKPERNDGAYVGAWVDEKGNQHYLRHNGPEHILSVAPTRSGKGVGLVIPTLLSWPHSAVITDLKGELWAFTAGWRKKYANNKVLRFEPASAGGGVCWNPLDEIRIDTEYEVGDVQNLATLIVDPDGKGLKDHWQKTSQALIVGLILHALYKAKKEDGTASLPSVDAMLSDPNRDISELWMEMVTYSHSNDKNHPVVAAAGRDMMDRPEEEAGSVLSTAKSYLSLYRDPVVARNVSKSEFKIKDLMNHNNPVSLYIVTQPNDKERLKPLVRVMLNMIVRLLADKMEFEHAKASSNSSLWRRILGRLGIKQNTYAYVRTKKSYKHRLLGMIDEFPSLGKLEILQESMAFLAGYGIKFYLICQDLNQLRSRETGYGPDETITSNCHIQNAYPPNRLETAEHISKLSGQTTVVKEHVSTSGRRVGIFDNQVSRHMQEVQRPLLTPDECMRMPAPVKNDAEEITEAGDMVIYVHGKPMIYGRQPLYFQDDVFLARAAVEAPKQSDKLRIVEDKRSPERRINLNAATH